MYMRLPAGIEIKGDTAEMHVLTVLKNLYSGMQTKMVWADHLT